MQKIFNWTVGSFFRSIGRIIAYIVVGAIIAYLLSANDFRIEDLFLDKVAAAEYVDGFDTTYYSDSALQNRYSSNGWYDYTSATTATSPNGAFTESWFYLNPMMQISHIRTGEFTIPIYISTPTVSNTTQTVVPGMDYCDRWTWGAIDSYNQVTRWDCARLNQTDSYTINDKEFITPHLTVSAFVQYENGYIDICSVDMSKNLITCPIANYTTINYVKGIQVQSRVYYSSGTTTTYYIGFFRKINRYGNSTQAIIDNQNQNTQATINNQNQNTQQILDDNTTQADSEGQDFINNFSNNTHGLTGIITAPLNAIQSLASATCSNLVLPLPFTNNKTLTLPCMSTIYSNHFGAFYTMYQGIILALISYWVCVRLFTLAKGFKDPDDDKIEVVDL